MRNIFFLPAGVDKQGSTTLPRGSALCGPCSRVRQCITPFMVRLAGVSTNVYPRHFVVANQFIELLPKVLVYDCPTGGVTPSIVLPSRKELSDPATHIVGVRQDRDLARTLKGAEPFDRSGQFHSIVRRLRHSSLQHALMFAVPKDARPASRTGIPQARAVNDDLDFAPFRSGNGRQTTPLFQITSVSWCAGRHDRRDNVHPCAVRGNLYQREFATTDCRSRGNDPRSANSVRQLTMSGALLKLLSELTTTDNSADPLTTALRSLPRPRIPRRCRKPQRRPLHRVRHCARSASDGRKSRTADAQMPGYTTRTRHRQMTGRVIGSQVMRYERVANYSVMHKSVNTAGKVTAKTLLHSPTNDRASGMLAREWPETECRVDLFLRS